MNLKKVELILENIGNMFHEDNIKDSEYLLVVANMLITFGRAGVELDDGLKDININDAHVIELALNQNPNNVHLAAILQGHILIKWTESFIDEPRKGDS